MPRKLQLGLILVGMSVATAAAGLPLDMSGPLSPKFRQCQSCEVTVSNLAKGNSGAYKELRMYSDFLGDTKTVAPTQAPQMVDLGGVERIGFARAILSQPDEKPFTGLHVVVDGERNDRAYRFHVGPVIPVPTAVGASTEVTDATDYRLLQKFWFVTGSDDLQEAAGPIVRPLAPGPKSAAALVMLPSQHASVRADLGLGDAAERILHALLDNAVKRKELTAEETDRLKIVLGLDSPIAATLAPPYDKARMAKLCTARFLAKIPLDDEGGIRKGRAIVTLDRDPFFKYVLGVQLYNAEGQ